MKPSPAAHPSDLPTASALTPEQAVGQPAPPPQIEGYEILQELAAAGQGRVWRARQLSTRREVALKVPRVDLLRSRVSLTRFEREVELAARLNHPHIARIYDSGIHQGLYYYAMELIDGMWLDTYVREHNLSLPQILGLMAAVCDAVQHAHQNGVIHRDLKPSNILVTRDGQPHIVDFGLAAAIAREDQAGTVSLEGEVTGTPAYMSPEQAAGRRERVDTRTDVYSLGIVFYKLVTGSFPYDVNSSMLQTLQNIRERDPVRPSKLARHLDRDAEAIILKALEKEPARRYQSVAELKADIDRRLEGMPVCARSTSSLYLLRKIIARHRYTSTVAALLVVIVLGFLGFSLQLSVGLQQKDRELLRQKEWSVDQEVWFARYAQARLLTRFLEAWQRGDRQSLDYRGGKASFHTGTREARAMRFLEDERRLDDKISEFRQQLQTDEPGFAEFIIAEHYLHDGQPGRAEAAYRACLSAPGLEGKDPELAVWIRNRLYQLTEGGARGRNAPTGEGREP
jgi:serine/threonine protein kinase